MVKSCVAFLACFVLLHQGCSNNDSPPPPVVPEIPTPELLVDWVGSIEAGLRLRTNDSGRVLVELSRNDSTVFSGSVSAAETTLVQSGLLPNQAYGYQAGRVEDGEVVKTSEVLTFVTLDTTSHEFTWQKDELGNFGGYLKDVIAISQDDVWGGGFLPIRPMSTVDANNSVHWNGTNWSEHQILFTSCDTSGNPTVLQRVQIESIFAFGQDDVWFTGGGGFVHLSNGDTVRICLRRSLLTGSIRKLWGTSSSNLFAVGTNGLVLHYDGARWRAMESGTEVDLQDVWGTADGSVVWACGWTDNVGTVLLAYQDGQWRTVHFDSENRFNIRQDTLSSIWTSVWTENARDVSILAPAGLYIASSRTRGEAWLRKWFADMFAPGFPRRVRGTASNDLFVVGDFSMVAHYNGASWRFYRGLFGPTGRMRSVAVIADEVFVVGNATGRAVVYHGKRR